MGDITLSTPGSKSMFIIVMSTPVTLNLPMSLIGIFGPEVGLKPGSTHLTKLTYFLLKTCM